jgi:hypothetical protein
MAENYGGREGEYRNESIILAMFSTLSIFPDNSNDVSKSVFLFFILENKVKYLTPLLPFEISSNWEQRKYYISSIKKDDISSTTTKDLMYSQTVSLTQMFLLSER